MTNGTTIQIPNFYGFSKLEVSDFFPSKAAGTTLNSECQAILDFKRYSSSGGIPSEIVNNANVNPMPGICPDVSLYIQAPDNSCSTAFQVNSVMNRVPAQVAP
jgi:hypothetical protein